MNILSEIGLPQTDIFSTVLKSLSNAPQDDIDFNNHYCEVYLGILNLGMTDLVPEWESAVAARYPDESLKDKILNNTSFKTKILLLHQIVANNQESSTPYVSEFFVPT